MSASPMPSNRTRHVAIALVAGTIVAGVAFAAYEESASTGYAATPAPVGVAVTPAPLYRSPLPGSALPPSTPPVATASAGEGITVSARLDRTRVLKGSDGLVRAELTVTAEASDDTPQMAPTDLVVLLDASSSMSGVKFTQAMSALHGLVGRLRPVDRFALIRYDSDARVTIPLSEAGPDQVGRWRAQFRAMSPGGSTNIGAALEAADALAAQARSPERPMRVLLISDGAPTAGDTSDHGLTTRTRTLIQRDIAVGAIGVGLGFNEVLMAKIADTGAGNFHSLHGEGDLAGIMTTEFDAARTTVATGVAVRIDPASGVRLIDAAGYPIEQHGNTRVFRPGTLQANRPLKLWVTLAVPTGETAERALGAVEVHYNRDGAREMARIDALPMVACVAGQEAFAAGLDKGLWEQSVVDGAFADVEKKLAEFVRQGRADDARKVLDDYAQNASALNAFVGSVAVTDHMQVVQRRRAELDDAFTGAGQAHKQNVFSKMNTASGWSRSRGGRGSFSGR